MKDAFFSGGKAGKRQGKKVSGGIWPRVPLFSSYGAV
jgi:hypothetical protein